MLDKMRNWQPPEHWLKITTIDCHTAGEPFRVITGGFPELPGDTILARRRYAREHLDHLRTALMWEPRGHADMYGCIVTPPVSPEADIGMLFMHNEGYSTMCGHGIIGITKVALETGLLPMVEPGDRDQDRHSGRAGHRSRPGGRWARAERLLSQCALFCPGPGRDGRGARAWARCATTWPLAAPSTPTCRLRMSA